MHGACLVRRLLPPAVVAAWRHLRDSPRSGQCRLCRRNRHRPRMKERMPHPERLMVIVLFDRVDLLDISGPPEVCALLQREMDAPCGYQVLLAAVSLEPVTTAAGVRVLPDIRLSSLQHQAIDTLIVPGSVNTDAQGRVQALADP